MKKQIEAEIEILQNERNLISNDIELSILEIDEWSTKMNMIAGKIEALKWCLTLIK